MGWNRGLNRGREYIPRFNDDGSLLGFSVWDRSNASRAMEQQGRGVFSSLLIIAGIRGWSR